MLRKFRVDGAGCEPLILAQHAQSIRGPGRHDYLAAAA